MFYEIAELREYRAEVVSLLTSLYQGQADDLYYDTATVSQDEIDKAEYALVVIDMLIADEWG